MLPLVIKIFVVSILEWPFYTGFTVAGIAILLERLGKLMVRVIDKAICAYSCFAYFMLNFIHRRNQD